MKEIRFQLGGQALTGQLGSRIEKKALYGYSRRVVESEGKLLSRGVLSADGRLLRREEMAVVKIDPDGTPVEELANELDGERVELKPSAFDQENPLTPVPLVTLANFSVSDVYPLDAVTVAPGLYATEFSYRKSIQPKEALLLVKSGGEGYLLVGAAKQTTLVGLTVAYSFFDADDDEEEDAEDLDFSMV